VGWRPKVVGRRLRSGPERPERTHERQDNNCVRRRSVATPHPWYHSAHSASSLSNVVEQSLLCGIVATANGDGGLTSGDSCALPVDGKIVAATPSFLSDSPGADSPMKVRLRPLREQVVVITGASSGIGLVTAKHAAQEGARVVLAARNERDLIAAVESI